jgi:hypothetical protein
VSRRAADPRAQTIEDAARALVAELRRREQQHHWLLTLRKVADAWPTLARALRALEDAVTAHPITPPAPAHYRENADAVANRQHKGDVISAWADALHLTPEQLEQLDPYLKWSTIAREQGVNTPSPDSRRHAVELLRRRRSALPRV